MLRSLSLRSEFAGFVVAGGLAALANIGSRWLLSHALPYPLAIVLAYLVGMITAYALMRSQVFAGSDRGTPSEVFRFVVVNLLAVAQTLLVSLGLAYHLLPWLGVTEHAETWAHLVGVAVPVVSSYYSHKHWTFGKG